LIQYGARQNLNIVRGFIQPIVKAALERKKANQGSSVESETLLDELVAQTTGNVSLCDSLCDWLIVK
jgi:hypothetical protein